METFVLSKWLMICLAIFSVLSVVTNCVDKYYDWDVSYDHNLQPLGSSQSVITINGLFPGPLINGTTNDNIHVNVHNNLDEPLLMTWNGIQQRLNSWQDGVSGTNCPILPGQNWTYNFQLKDQIGTFSYFPSTNYQKAAGGFGPIRVNNRNVISVPFPQPEGEFDIIVNDWFKSDYKDLRSSQVSLIPDAIIINGQGPGEGPLSIESQAFFVTKGKTYRFQVSNLGSLLSINFRIQNHQMVLVETEGSYTSQITLDSLDVHVGQSYSVLVTADQDESQYYIVASPKFIVAYDNSPLVAKAKLHYDNSVSSLNGPLPSGPDPFDKEFSINQAKSIRWNLTSGAARPNPQGSFNVKDITLSQTFVLHGSKAEINGETRYVINNVSYKTPSTPLKLADFYVNGFGVYQLDTFPVQPTYEDPTYATSVVTGQHKGWLEIVFHNDLDGMVTWHLDGYGLYVVGFGDGEWTIEAQSEYNIDDPVLRSTVQVYPHGWTAVYVFLDNPGMWNLRSQILRNWYFGQELYIRVFDSDPNPAKERPPPDNLLLCGIFGAAKSPVGLPIYVLPPGAAPAPSVAEAPWFLPSVALTPAPSVAEAPWFLPTIPPTPAPAPAPEGYWW